MVTIVKLNSLSDKWVSVEFVHARCDTFVDINLSSSKIVTSCTPYWDGADKSQSQLIHLGDHESPVQYICGCSCWELGVGEAWRLKELSNKTSRIGKILDKYFQLWGSLLQGALLVEGNQLGETIPQM